MFILSNDIPSEFKGFQSYKEAVTYLGWDPATTGSPPAQKIDPKPPKWDIRLTNVAGLTLGLDPNQWCGTHVMSLAVTINRLVVSTIYEDNSESSASNRNLPRQPCRRSLRQSTSPSRTTQMPFSRQLQHQGHPKLKIFRAIIASKWLALIFQSCFCKT